MDPTASSVVVVLAAPSKVPFYVAGGALAAWAVLVAALGIRGFLTSAVAGRAVMGVSMALVAVTIAMAIVTAGEEPAEHAEARTTPAGSTPAAPTLNVAADPSGAPAYSPTSLTAAPGRATIHMANRSPVPHNVTIARGGRTIGATKTVTDADSSVTVDLMPGSYVYYCSVDQHRQAGMRGTLSVR